MVSTASRLRQYVTQFGENIFSTDGTILFCKVCKNKIKFEVKARILVTLSMEEYDVICPVLHERRAAAIPCVTVESAHYLTSIRSGLTSHTLQNNIVPSVENMFSPNCVTYCLKRLAVDPFYFGISIALCNVCTSQVYCE